MAKNTLNKDGIKRIKRNIFSLDLHVDRARKSILFYFSRKLKKIAQNARIKTRKLFFNFVKMSTRDVLVVKFKKTLFNTKKIRLKS